ncbi:MAG TPA: hypothetical protein VKP65_11755 [Rhodothermales bacterium]|nr:hypothetical protein [Rhodothermales bacterium]
MNEEQPIARSSMVPILGCIALMLFSLSSYKIIDKYSPVCIEPPSHVVEVHRHNGVFAFEFDGAEAEIARAQREIERSHQIRERALRRSVERAEQALVRLQTIEDDRVQIHIERLEEELQAKAHELENLEHELTFSSGRLDWKCEMDHADHSDFQIHVVR